MIVDDSKDSEKFLLCESNKMIQKNVIQLNWQHLLILQIDFRNKKDFGKKEKIACWIIDYCSILVY